MSISEQLTDILQSVVHPPGDFYAAGVQVTPLPALEVEGVGPLSFPLPPEQARRLIEVAERAPYGRGPDTLVDPAVRRAWQIAPDRLRFGAGPWSETLSAIVDRVSARMGVAGGVSAELYKLMIYDPGSFFVPHRDTEKAPGMFGTLVVVLPSPHEGGALEVRHAGRQVTLDLPGAPPWQVSYAAFFADCLHALNPITEGVRLALIYKLVRGGGGPTPTPPDHREATARVAQVLDHWLGLLDREGPAELLPEKLVCVLEHRYTPAEHAFAGLKGADAATASVLRAAANAAGFRLDLALMSIEERGSARPADGGPRHNSLLPGWRNESDRAFEVLGITDRSLTLTDWRDPEDAVVGLGPMPVEAHELCPQGALDDAPPDEKAYQEANGNEGATFERAWRRAALVLWPAYRFLDLISVAGPQTALPYLEALMARGAEGATGPEVLGLAERVLLFWPEQPVPGPAWRARTLRALVRLGDARLLEQMITQVLAPRKLQREDFDAVTDALRAGVGGARVRVLLASLLPPS